MSKPAPQDIENFVTAATAGHGSDVEKFLAKYGAAIINEFDSTGHNALMMAVCNGRHMIMDTLLKAGADIECKNTYDSTALIYAIECQNKNAVELLLQNGAAFDIETAYGKLVLTIAEFRGDPGIVALLEQWHEKRKQQWLEDTDCSKGLRRPIPAHRPLKSTKPKP